MVDHDGVEELAVFLLSNVGRNEAIATYEEEMGCSHSEAVEIVEELRRRLGTDRPALSLWRIGILAGAAVGIVALLTALW